jgi:hypothetical protein
MSDRYAGRIEIGGVLPAAKLAELAMVIQEEDHDVEMNWNLGDDRRITAKVLRDWLKRRDSPRPLCLHGGELVDGSFPTLERWLWTHGMSYLRHSDAYSDIEAEIVGYVDGNHVRHEANNSGDVMVFASDVRRAHEALREGRVLDAMDILCRLLPANETIPPFEVSRAGRRRR